MSQSFGMIEVYGHTEISNQLSVFRTNVNAGTEQALNEAAAHMVSLIRSLVPRDKWNLYKSITSGPAVGTPAVVSFSHVRAGSRGIVVGVDPTHPGTRVRPPGTVTQYAKYYMPAVLQAIDASYLDGDLYLKQKIQEVVNKATKPFLSRVGSRIMGAVRSLMNTVKGFFGR
jgi:hypothetical protein